MLQSAIVKHFNEFKAGHFHLSVDGITQDAATLVLEAPKPTAVKSAQPLIQG